MSERNVYIIIMKFVQFHTYTTYTIPSWSYCLMWLTNWYKTLFYFYFCFF